MRDSNVALLEPEAGPALGPERMMYQMERTAPNDCGTSCLPHYLDAIHNRLKSPLARRALALLREEPTAFVSVGEWANRMQVSREHLTRSISPVINPHALIQATRLALAMEKLARQKLLRAGEALGVMGYSSRAHAFTVFKSITGITPTEWWHRFQDRRGTAPVCITERCPLVRALLDRSHEPTEDDGSTLAAGARRFSRN